MKKIKIILVLLAISLFTISAQNPINRNRVQLNAGVGITNWGIPIYAGMDFGINNDVTLGFEASFRNYNEKYTNVNYNSTILGISGNANYHFNRVLNIPREWDFYAGLNLGFYSWQSPDGYPGNGNSGLGLGAQIGGRYFLSETIGLNLEVGGGNAFSGGKFGLTFLF